MINRILSVLLYLAMVLPIPSLAGSMEELLNGENRCYSTGCTTELSRSPSLNTRYLDGNTVYKQMQDGTYSPHNGPQPDQMRVYEGPETYRNVVPDKFDTPGTGQDNWKRSYGR